MCWCCIVAILLSELLALLPVCQPARNWDNCQCPVSGHRAPVHRPVNSSNKYQYNSGQKTDLGDELFSEHVHLISINDLKILRRSNACKFYLISCSFLPQINQFGAVYWPLLKSWRAACKIKGNLVNCLGMPSKKKVHIKGKAPFLFYPLPPLRK